MRYLRNLFAISICGVALGTAACGDDSGTGAGGSSVGGQGTGAGSSEGVCILHNCTEDAHCGACTEGRIYCLIESGSDYGRCVSCGSGTTGGCPEGQECSSFGECVPLGLTCPTDGMGTPTISCANSGDCAACDPAHQVCDPNSHLCVGCTDTDTSECQSTDICKDGKCAPACSNDCTSDNECSKCPGAKACNNHICSECSETYACAAGMFCNLQTGTCEKTCGLEKAPGTCVEDMDCNGCQGTNKCYKPLNADPMDIGTCGPVATGCSDLGDGALTLPEPYNQITNTCSNDNDCSNVGITYNVGKALRELIGSDEVLGQTIDDANIEYPMSTCASVTVAENSCGVCVPCSVDADCQDINLDMLSGDLFPGVGGIVIALLFDQLFGPDEHNLYMYCQSVASGYGVCVPCPGLVNDCAQTGGGGGSGTCDHDPSMAGGPLDPGCDTCAATVCDSDPFCCNTEWDQLCVDAAAAACGGATCHDECAIGEALNATCGTCATDVCAADPYCCETSWDSTCVSEAVDICGITCP